VPALEAARSLHLYASPSDAPATAAQEIVRVTLGGDGDKDDLIQRGPTPRQRPTAAARSPRSRRRKK
jgi:hypothetical protein